MKWIRVLCVVLFVAIVLAPLAFFNTEPDSVSAIDNRKLAGNPFAQEGDLTLNVQNYVNDRIGFRNELITGYTVLNDRLFGKMVHPSYSYGKDGYVFGAGVTTGNNFSQLHIAFADMVAQIQDYCNERNVPFLFVFNPAKPAVYQDKIAEGIHYDRQWVDLLFAELDQRGVNYLDNTKTLQALRQNAENGFNQKYDANHWNDLGAFYGTQAMLERLHALCDTVYVNKLEDFDVSQKLETSLMVSKFPIHEYVPAISLKTTTSNLYSKYLPGMKIDPSFQGFGYFVNDADAVKDTPKTLVFQGSYMNDYGHKFLQNAFREYIYVHDYQNVIDFPYYFNIFQPECVVFEVAEYTFSDTYFNCEKMLAADYNPALSAQVNAAAVDVEAEAIAVDVGEHLTTITWNTDRSDLYVWIVLDHTYDMQKVEAGYQATIETERYTAAKDRMQLFAAAKGSV